MKKYLPTGSLEKSVMECIWRHNEKTVRQVYDCLNKQRSIAYTTVMTVMNRLVDKGILKRKKQGRCYVYSPRMSPQESLKKFLHQTLKGLIDNYGYQAVAAFADEIQNLDEEKRKMFKERLKNLI